MILQKPYVLEKFGSYAKMLYAKNALNKSDCIFLNLNISKII